MTTNPNLKLLMEKMFEDEEAIDKITDTDDMEELYRVCLDIQDGYTLQEFVDFFENLVYICKEEAKEFEKIDENQLEDVSGGANMFNRLTASTLASLTFLTANRVGALDVGDTDILGESDSHVELRKLEPGEEIAEPLKDSDVNLRSMDDEEEDEKQSFATKAKNWLANAADAVWDNKGKIFAVSVALILGGGLLIAEKDKIIKNIEKRREEKQDIKDMKEQLKKLEVEGSKGKKVDWKLMIELQNYIDRKEDESALPTLTKGLTVTGAAASATGALWKVVKKGYKHFKSATEVMSTISTMYWSISGNREMYRALKNKIELQLKKTFSDFDYNDGGKKLDLLFREKVHGQESAKKELKKFYNIFASALEDERNGMATPQQLSPQILVLNGPSGTGKTFMAQLLTQCLTDIDPFIISAGELMKESDRDWHGDIATAFIAGGKRAGTAKGDSGASYNNLASYLSSTQGSVRVVIVDEYDKMYVGGAKHPLDETFREILANNLTDPYTMEKLDLSKTIFICTTNETRASLQGRIVFKGGTLREKEVDENGKFVQNENGRQSYIDPITDDTGTQTLVPHDSSFIQRISGQTCYFDSLTHDDYLKIVHDALDDDPNIRNMEELKNIGGTDRVILRNRIHYKLGEIEIDPEGYDLIANYASEMPSAARAIVGAGGNTTGSVAGNLNSAIIEKCSVWQANGYSVKNMKIKAIPREEVNSSGMRVINFEIKCVGYKDN